MDIFCAFFLYNFPNRKLNFWYAERTYQCSLPLQAILSLLMLIPGDIGQLIDFFSFAAWLFYALAIVSLFILRWKMKDAHRPIKVSIIFKYLHTL